MMRLTVMTLENVGIVIVGSAGSLQATSNQTGLRSVCLRLAVSLVVSLEARPLPRVCYGETRYVGACKQTRPQPHVRL